MPTLDNKKSRRAAAAQQVGKCRSMIYLVCQVKGRDATATCLLEKSALHPRRSRYLLSQRHTLAHTPFRAHFFRYRKLHLGGALKWPRARVFPDFWRDFGECGRSARFGRNRPRSGRRSVRSENWREMRISEGQEDICGATGVSGSLAMRVDTALEIESRGNVNQRERRDSFRTARKRLWPREIRGENRWDWGACAPGPRASRAFSGCFYYGDCYYF